MPEHPARPAGSGTPGLRPRWWKVLRDLWLHKARTALVIAAIVVGLVGAGTVLDTWALLRVVTRDGYLMTKPAAGTVRFDVVDSALLASIRALPSVRAATARQTVSARIRTPRDGVQRSSKRETSWPPPSWRSLCASRACGRPTTAP